MNSNAPKWRCLAVTILLVGSLSGPFAGCDRRESSDSKPTPVLSGAPQTTYPMPPLKIDSEMGWTLAGGQRTTLVNYGGKVLVLDFYATWCAPCRESIPKLKALQEKYGPSGLQVVGLNVGGADDRIKVAGFAEEMGIHYPLGFPDKSLTEFFLSDDQTIPQTFVFGRSGHLARRLIGYQESTGRELEQVIQTEIARKE